MLLSELLDVRLLDRMLAEGYVRAQDHPSLPLRIYNYSHTAVFDRVWNAVTRQTRGLIVHAETGEIVARPFAKFYNYGEPDAPQSLSPNERVVVTDKLDGSLGVLFDNGDGGAIATRGSFASEQAAHATRIWKRRYAHRVLVPSGLTPLFEIIYPGNRIVCDYGDMDDLVLLGAVEIASGMTVSAAVLAQAGVWPGPVVSSFPFATLAEALAAKPREGAEGLVVELVDRGDRVKLKQEDYVALHRLVTGLSTKTVFEQIAPPPLGRGDLLSELLRELPEEFGEWVEQTAEELCAAAEALGDEVQLAYDELVTTLPEGFSRKDFALRAKEHRHAPALFKLLDGADLAPWAWRLVKPEYAPVAPMARAQGEDVA